MTKTKTADKKGDEKKVTAKKPIGQPTLPVWLAFDPELNPLLDSMADSAAICTDNLIKRCEVPAVDIATKGYKVLNVTLRATPYEAANNGGEKSSERNENSGDDNKNTGNGTEPKTVIVDETDKPPVSLNR